jgi:hypothetical protein
MGERAEEGGKKEEKAVEEKRKKLDVTEEKIEAEAEAVREPILIIIEDSNQSPVLPPKAESEV